MVGGGAVGVSWLGAHSALSLTSWSLGATKPSRAGSREGQTTQLRPDVVATWAPAELVPKNLSGIEVHWVVTKQTQVFRDTGYLVPNL